MPAQSLPSNINTPSNKPVRHNFSLPRPRPQYPTSPIPPVPTSTSPRSETYSYPNHLKASSDSDPRLPRRPHTADDQPVGESHPYANPEFALPETVHVTTSPSSSSFSGLRKDSVGLTSEPQPAAPKPVMTDLATPPRHRERTSSHGSSLRGKISSPIAVVNPATKPLDAIIRDGRPPPLSPNRALPAWVDIPTSPSFNLVSLEEARAQRVRTQSAISPASSGSISSSSRQLAFPEPDQGTQNAHSRPSSSGTGAAPRPRARSISAGAKAKSALNSIVGNSSNSKKSSDPLDEQTPQGKPALRHKKSGLMRLFNGVSKDKSGPPPVPALSDAHHNTPMSTPSTPPAVPKSHRVPVPRLTTSDHSDSSSSTESHTRVEEPVTLRSLSKTPPAAKRTPPPLSISTGSTGLRPISTAPASAGPRGAPSSPSSKLTVGNSRVPPQSAPSERTDFPSLSLRPVSAAFSAHFSEHIVSPLSEFRDANRASTPSTPLDAFTPITPGSSMRSTHSRTTIVSLSSSDDQSALIQALQEQIITSKKAWQQQIWELECQVRDLKAEVEELRQDPSSGTETEYCEVCHRGQPPEGDSEVNKSHGVVDRPRPKTGDGSGRFGAGN